MISGADSGSAIVHRPSPWRAATWAARGPNADTYTGGRRSPRVCRYAALV